MGDTMPRTTWTGRKATAATRYTITRDGGTCHLCQHPGANSCDHVIPVHVDPSLEWVPSNWRAAHLGAAGTHDGCPEPGCHCPGNRIRRDAPADQVRTIVAELNRTTQPTPSRDW